MYDQNKVDEFFFRSEELIGKVDKEEAFSIITKEIEDCEDSTVRRIAKVSFIFSII
ncbi:hypothetical protein [Flectobacillus roseus]|uniref:hypothetical protein n=1 Tax=Flectobacillus roseus TaxID=502259 RepID=UPI0024B84580|nr:hypothetical protein [Flectobacillus roseus]MDI9871499.1 hypothetical protein [Flectobacillus roseus]